MGRFFHHTCRVSAGQAMENRHQGATDQLSKLYQRKLSHESDRHLVSQNLAMIGLAE